MDEHTRDIMAAMALVIAQLKQESLHYQQVVQKYDSMTDDDLMRNDYNRIIQDELKDAKATIADRDTTIQEQEMELRRQRALYDDLNDVLQKLKATLNSDKWFSIVKVLNKWRKGHKQYKKRIRKHLEREFLQTDQNYRDKIDRLKYQIKCEQERYIELNTIHNKLSASFNQQLKEKQTHRFQMNGEWLEMTTQELIDFYCLKHPQKKKINE